MDKRNFDEAPRPADPIDQEAEEIVDGDVAEELAMQAAGSTAAVGDPQPAENDPIGNIADHSSEDSVDSDTPSSQTAGGSIFSTFGVIPPTYPSRTPLRSGIEEANWFNQFRERLVQSYTTPQTSEMKTFDTSEAAGPIAESDDTDESTDTDGADVIHATQSTDTGTADVETSAELIDEE